MSCSKPNLQQVPHTTEARSCFVAPPGHKLIIADYSASQLRIAAEFTEDPELLRCFCSNPPIDPHKRTASSVLGVPMESVTKDQRTKAKAINFGLLFGMTPYGFVYYAKDVYSVTFTLKEAVEAHRRFFGLYRGLAVWHQKSRHKAPRVLLARTASGRLWRFSTPDPKKLVKQFLCMPIQGTEADGLKRAIALMYPRLMEIGAFIVNVIHDEVVVEAPEAVAERAKEIVVRSMKGGMGEFLKKVPVEVDAIVASAWVKP